MKASLTDLAKSRQKNAEEFRGQQPQARSPSLAHCSTINSTLEMNSACCLKEEPKLLQCELHQTLTL